MGIFSRTRDIIRAHLNALLDKAEAPEKLVAMMVREMEDSLASLKTTCAGAMAARRKAQRQAGQAREYADAWGDKAEAAVARGRDDQARHALVERRRYARREEALSEEVAQHDRVVGRCQEDIAELEEKIRDVREKQRVLIERHTHALQKKRAQTDIRRFDTSDTLARVDTLAERHAPAYAAADWGGSARRGDGLAGRFGELDGADGIEKELEELKAAAR
ncbi:MAG: PspA/IM30 family protein [Candidatus Hydrogenedentes bacterium]|nr:PspA/IM30 family protein [Candidatus Hydrogenedentota bacterium]